MYLKGFFQGNTQGTNSRLAKNMKSSMQIVTDFKGGYKKMINIITHDVRSLKKTVKKEPGSTKYWYNTLELVHFKVTFGRQPNN